ncbi:pilus assembly protein TadG-related protein [Pseudarthrobacter sp. MDT3-26]|uniref:pilus assembly protein TadG-related protein n=1 Tax=Pseudarthrobacter raffinosi TaxID=2953651 RepID=UPI00208F2E81|nr:pilus assembly protein TadG-related protein [Pseudarthrobacter sp. MDT3-26]MCO4263362.1 pilus assembly protein TadG-related protein [Pseudarthrobacter sp. MDT3-26]
MRRLTPSKRKNDGERGAVSVIVAFMLVALLGFGAIAVDVSMLYAERTQLRNGADAAALAIAQRCAASASDPGCSATSTLAASLTSSNANDGLSNIKSTVLDTSARTVTVTASAQEAGHSPNEVSLFFARTLGMNTAEVNAPATVKWGSPIKGPTPFPVTVSICQVRDSTNVMQLLQLHGKNANADCNYGPSGAAVEGGFGGLKQDPGECGAIIDIATSTAGGDTGNNAPPHCEATLNAWAADMNAGKDVVILLPIFNKVTGSGTNAVFKLTTFAAFRVAGWKVGNTGLPYTFRNRAPDVPAALECREPCRGIIGTFVRHVSLAAGYTLGPINPDGATVVALSN